MIMLLAVIGFIGVVRLAYLHYVKYQQLKAENVCLRQYWKEEIAGKP